MESILYSFSVVLAIEQILPPSPDKPSLPIHITGEIRRFVTFRAVKCGDSVLASDRPPSPSDTADDRASMSVGVRVALLEA
jgi:hypothetical protein